MPRSSYSPVLMIALDAADASLIERWTADGTLPNLARLRERGAYGRMASTADWLAGTPWPSFYTGTLPPEHGFLFHVQWRPDRMCHDRPRNDWLPLTPFYRRFGHHGKRTVAIDVPITYGVGPEDDFDGVEVTSWSTHDKIGRTSAYPPGTMKRIRRRFGREPITIEAGGPQRQGALLRLRDRLVSSVERQTALATLLMREQRWDFFLLALGAAHRGGHKLWDRSSIKGDLRPENEERYDTALRDIYVACDEAVGRLVAQAGPDVTVLVCALHGMATTNSRFHMTPMMLERVLSVGESATAARAMPGISSIGLQRLRSALPLGFRTALKSRLPERLQDRLTMYWQGTDKRDWSRTRAFCLMGDLQALVHVNLRGREAAGIVEPGQEYEQLLNEISDGLMSFVDADTGEPVVKRIGRGNELYPDARRRRVQPDLIIDWADGSVLGHRAFTSPRFGTVDWPTPGHPLDGRGGHHVSQGWLLAVGESIEPGTRIENAHSHDLNATIHALLDVPRPDYMRGCALEAICGARDDGALE